MSGPMRNDTPRAVEVLTRALTAGLTSGAIDDDEFLGAAQWIGVAERVVEDLPKRAQPADTAEAQTRMTRALERADFPDVSEADVQRVLRHAHRLRDLPTGVQKAVTASALLGAFSATPVGLAELAASVLRAAALDPVARAAMANFAQAHEIRDRSCIGKDEDR